ncbi:asparagine synthase-domain-containing protein [Mycena belliarum]|uniref:Asparagine synthase-domain-containing protein n=1 Tax=Mycena belliarum TaxID=1033014 RepID=A0AAD6XWX2_9AGAR|nr:asparagine synthase-domain-containing protein [Mycena belliae]
MCGVFFCVRHSKDDSPALLELCGRLQYTNGARGPDSQGTQRISVTGPDELNHAALTLDLYASELRLRGIAPIVQPHEQDGNVFCWNGEIFDGMEISKEENDGVKLFRALRALETLEQVCDLFGRIEGPYAFVYYHAASRRVLFARDPLGRRSLLIHRPTIENPYFLLASVSTGSDPACEFQEVSTEYIYCLELLDLIASNFDSALAKLPRSSGAGTLYSQLCSVNTTLPPDDWPVITSLETPGYLTQAVDDFIARLDRSVELRVRNVPQPSIREFGAQTTDQSVAGIDCTTLAFLAHKHLPPDEPIDLLNVAFENPRKVKLQAGETGSKSKKKHPTSAVEPRPLYMVPDRVTGLQEVEELRRLCPRVWNFVSPLHPFDESQQAIPVIEALMFPAKTVMDLSLALALYFASRGKGQIRRYPGADGVTYTTPAKVLLNGLGSDELLGGYGRHRTAYGSGGWKGVIDELQLEIDRIPSRNLGRDDRVISSHGKETRHPFLSLSIVSFLANLPVHLKMDPRAETGLGDKMLLRSAARKMGLVEASSRKKRAMQFGSHSARMDGEKRGDIPLKL